MISNEVKVFNEGLNTDLSPFQIPSSPKLDQMWSDLYNFGLSHITQDEAARLPNKTHAIPGYEGHYVAALDVFHSLHCLVGDALNHYLFLRSNECLHRDIQNKIRKALDPAYYPEMNIKVNDKAEEHISHCVDWLRQQLMCHSDTSVIVYAFSCAWFAYSRI